MEKRIPRITVITPSYNQGRFIESTIKSVLAQQYPNLEYLVFDAESTDETKSILEKYSDCVRWQSEKDDGQADAVNKGLKLASGEIIGWLNSDDIYYPDVLQYVAKYFIEHPEVDVVYGQALNIDEVGNVLNRYATKPWNLKALHMGCYISQPATFFRKSVVERYGALNPILHYCMDYEFWLRLGSAGVKFAYVEQLFAGARFHQDTKSLKHFHEAHAEIVEMFAKHFNTVPPTCLLNYASATVKVNSKKALLHPSQIKLFYKTLWQMLGKHYSGSERLKCFVKSQIILSQRVFNKITRRFYRSQHSIYSL